MSNAPLMPKATAVWLLDNTALTFDQVADFTKMHPLEIRAIADGDAAQGIKGMDPISNGQLTREEIEKGEKALIAALKLKSQAKSGNAKEDDAYASQDYQTWLRGYAAAVENLTVLENKRGRAETVIELYRTESANHRRL